MAATAVPQAPGFATFLKVISSEPAETSIQYFIHLLRRRQIRGPKACAVATAYLLRRVIALTKGGDHDRLIARIQEVGRRLANAAPRELAIGNIVRRVLGLVRDEDDENRGDTGDSGMSSEMNSEPSTPKGTASPNPGASSMPSINGMLIRREPQSGTINRPPLLSSQTGAPGSIRPFTSMFSIMSHPMMKGSGAESPRSGTATPQMSSSMMNNDLRPEIMEGISEIIDELDQTDDQIAGYALSHIHPDETIFTYSTSPTVQRFLLKAASKRKFTVIQAESYPNNHAKTHSLTTGNPKATHSYNHDEASNPSANNTSTSTADPDDDSEDETLLPHEPSTKPLPSAGVTVVLIPDSAIFALMSRADKVILSATAVLSNGSIIAPAGSRMVIKAARCHRVPVIVLAGTYRVSVLHAEGTDRGSELIEFGDVKRVFDAAIDGELKKGLLVSGGGESAARNPLTDFVDAHDIDLLITNLGATAASGAERIVRDLYWDEDLML